LGLLESQAFWSGGRLAERLGVGRRTLRRDIDRLRGLGYAIQGTRGGEGGYRLAASEAVPPLVVDAEEATAVLVGLRMLVDAGAPDGETALRALARLEDRLPPRVRLAAGATPGSSILVLLARAAEAGDRVRFTYRTRAGVESTRRAAPEALVLLQGRWFDRQRRDERANHGDDPDRRSTSDHERRVGRSCGPGQGPTVTRSADQRRAVAPRRVATRPARDARSRPSGPSASTRADATMTPSAPARTRARTSAGRDTPKPTPTGTGEIALTSLT